MTLFEKSLISDESFAGAYDKVNGDRKAIIKTAIALADFNFGRVNTAYSSNCKSSRSSIFWTKTERTAVSTALVIFNHDFLAMARLCAAAILPRLAGVERVLAISLDKKPSDSALVTLELCGCEELAVIPAASFSKILEELPSDTRVIGLYGSNVFECIKQASAKGLQVFYESVEPKIAVVEADKFDSDLFVFAQGIIPSDAHYLEHESYDAVYAPCRARDSSSQLNARLILGPGTEGFWMFPNMNLEFFMSIKGIFGTKSDLPA